MQEFFLRLLEFLAKKNIFLELYSFGSSTSERLKDGDEGEDGIEHGAGVGHEQLLLLHVEAGHEQLGRRQRAPDHHEGGAKRSEGALKSFEIIV